MSVIFIVILLAALLAGLVYPSLIAPQLGKPVGKKGLTTGFLFMLLAGIAVRVAAAGMYPGHETDMNCFYAWADSIYNNGFAAFYASEGFTDYPPGYMYMLYVLGFIQNAFHLQRETAYIVLKLPAILCDAATAYLVYKVARRHVNENVSFMLSAFYLFNPAVLTDSALWGQVDSVFTLFLVLMVLLVTEKKMIPAYFIFALAVFIKPQAFMFTPILIFGIVEHVFLNDYSREKFLKNLLYGLLAIACMFLISLPFGIDLVIGQYVDTLQSYPYLTINAFNLWGALGQNWTELNLLTSVLGYVLLAAIVAACVYIFVKARNRESKYFFIGAVLAFMTFMLSTKMHERYAFPAMVLILLCFVMEKDVKLFVAYALFSLSQFFNMAYVLFVYETNPGLYYKSPAVFIASFVNLAIMAYFIFVARGYCAAGAQPAASVPNRPAAAEIGAVRFEKSAPKVRLTRFDFVALVLIMAVYSGIAFYDLGDKAAPETEVVLTPESSVQLDLGEDKPLSQLKFFLGPYHLYDENRLFINGYDADGNETFSRELEDGAVFFWSEEDIGETSARYIELATDGTVSVKELGIYDGTGNLAAPVNQAEYGALFDEQQIIPQRQSFRNSTYFDEIYHARTAYEFINKLPVYEWTHPPLGKVFISIGIRLFGMNPFGWRVIGTLFGVLMIPCIYLFAKKLLKQSWLAVITCLLLTFDFMHFAQTRIATIDVYVTFFIILMYYFMYQYYSMSFYDTPFKKTLLPLGACGICMGLGIASKWTGIYAGAGLAVLFFMTIYKRYREYRYAKTDPKGSSDGISHQFVIEHFGSYTKKTVLFCCIMFIAVPLLIYLAAYIPYLAANGEGLSGIWKNQQDMLTYHGKTVVSSTHSYSSRWYQWPIMYRPIWYYSGTVSDTLKEGISSFGNPLVWWIGIPAFFYMIWNAFKKKDKAALFLCIAYIAQLLPWTVVFRTTFIYHYFPDVPFVVLMIGYSIYLLYQREKGFKIAAVFYTVAVIVLFAMFYPVLSGQPVNPEYVQQYLKWFDSWTLI